MKTKYEIFLQRNTTNFFFRNLCTSYILDLAKNVLALRTLPQNKRALSTGDPCTCEYVTLLQSFRRGALSIHWCIAQKL